MANVTINIPYMGILWDMDCRIANFKTDCLALILKTLLP